MTQEEMRRCEALANGLDAVRRNDIEVNPISSQCPRCGYLVGYPVGIRPCYQCQIKALEAEVKRLRGGRK
jgi:hypothetical protein